MVLVMPAPLTVSSPVSWLPPPSSSMVLVALWVPAADGGLWWGGGLSGRLCALVGELFGRVRACGQAGAFWPTSWAGWLKGGLGARFEKSRT